jgi:[protein-PII] uridylyltransferase
MKTTGSDPESPLIAALGRARRALAADTLAGAGGRDAVARYAERMDAVLQGAFAAAPAPTQAVALVALGGYGRRHLCLHSDIDLLVLTDGPVGPADERFVRGLLHALWDLNLTLGQQVRELAEFERLEVDNPEFLLALLDARLVAGDRGLFDRLMGLFHRPESHAAIVEALEALVAARHNRFDDTLYQLEPDIKDAPGALRDLMALRATARLTDPGLIARGPSEPARLDEAEDFLLRLRSILHLETKRSQNILTHALQEKTAHILGFEGVQPRQRVEGLMSEYFRHARNVSRSLAWIRQTAPRPVAVNLVQSRDGIRFIDPRRASREPETWLSLFQSAIDREVPVADEALAVVRQYAGSYNPPDFFPSAEHRAALLAFLEPKPGLYARLTDIHDCGMLGQMLPEFQAISCRVVRDFYHKYTVDEHTLLTIRNLERLLSPSTPSRARFRSLLIELEEPELLVLSLLYHDVGKWKDDNHATESVRMARRLFDRLQLPPASRETVEFLIRQHLQMSLVAFRRDTGDPEIVKRFARLVASEERLKLLCLLTLADVGAVSPDTLTPWREELIWRLYVDTYNQLTLQYADDVVERSEADLTELLARRPTGLTEAEIAGFVEGLPRRYLGLFSPEAIYAHVQLSRDIQPDHVHAALERRGSAWELAVVTLDKPFLFSNVCGVLSSFGMDILRGHALTNPNGLVLDIFHFTDPERFLDLNADGRARLLEVLADAVSGRTDVTATLRARGRGVFNRRASRRAPVVYADNQTSRRYTIVEVIATNRIGLLHRISRVISERGCDVDLVLISTEGEVAVDVFHITREQAKLSDEAQRELTADLQRVLEETDEAHQGHRPAEQGR